MLSEPAKLYGLIGEHLTHSFSLTYFNQKFEAENIDARYVNFEIPDIGDIMEIFAEHPNLAGLNVTIPYKEQVIPYLDDIDETAKRIGAVNVIKIKWDESGNPRLKGFNSDVIGFTDSILPMLGENRGKALILGTGGAAKAIYVGLVNIGIEPVFVSRNPKEGMLSYEELTEEIISDHHIIVNTTPLGMYPNVDTCPPIPYQFLTEEHICYDLIYNPDQTLFMKQSQKNGAKVKNGLEMLLLQAFESYRIWENTVW